MKSSTRWSAFAAMIGAAVALRALFLVSGGFVGWVLNGWGWSMRSGSLSVIAC
jgi:hypothetical protein